MSLALAKTGSSFVPLPGTAFVTENCGTKSFECRPCLFADHCANHCATFILCVVADTAHPLTHSRHE